MALVFKGYYFQMLVWDVVFGKGNIFIGHQTIGFVFSLLGF